MAEGLGVAASAIAVIELSAKVASLCLKYSKAVKNAHSDIFRLETEVINLRTLSEAAKQLLEGPYKENLQATQQLRGTL